LTLRRRNNLRAALNIRLYHPYRLSPRSIRPGKCAMVLACRRRRGLTPQESVRHYGPDLSHADDTCSSQVAGRG